MILTACTRTLTTLHACSQSSSSIFPFARRNKTQRRNQRYRRNQRNDATNATDDIDAMNAKDDAMDAMTQQTQIPEDEVNLVDYWRVVWKRRRLIGGLFVSAVLTALVVSLLMPKLYESTATLLPSLESKA